MKKIMFDDKYGLTRAVLEGRKTMTRRIVPEKLVDSYCDYNDYVTAVAPHDIPCSREYEKEFFLRHSRYKVGDVVAVAQAYRDIRDIIGDVHDGKSIKFMPGWSNKMFVRADLMPRQIRITGVRVERLQDISDEDCFKEGVDKAYLGYYVNGLKTKDWEKESHVEKDGQTYKLFPTPHEAFAALIDRISGKGTWENNPWVFVYDFELAND